MVARKETLIHDFADFVIPEEGLEAGHIATLISANTGEIIESWLYNGEYFVSSLKHRNFNIVHLDINVDILLRIPTADNLFIEYLGLDYNVYGNNNDKRYWDIELYRAHRGGERTLITAVDTKQFNSASLTIPINLEDLVKVNKTLRYELSPRKNKNPGKLTLSGDLYYRHYKNVN